MITIIGGCCARVVIHATLGSQDNWLMWTVCLSLHSSNITILVRLYVLAHVVLIVSFRICVLDLQEDWPHAAFLKTLSIYLNFIYLSIYLSIYTE